MSLSILNIVLAISFMLPFMQEKTSEFFVEPVVSKGRFIYRDGGSVRWEYLSPKRIVFDSDDSTTGDVSKRYVSKLLGMIGSSIRGEWADIEDDFDIERREGSVVLYPKQTEGMVLFQYLIIFFEGSSSIARQVEFKETNGDKTVIHFGDVERL